MEQQRRWQEDRVVKITDVQPLTMQEKKKKETETNNIKKTVKWKEKHSPNSQCIKSNKNKKK